VTHPFHPLLDREFALANYTYCWGEPRVFFYDGGRLCSLPAAWTTLAVVDPFVEVAAGRSDFRFDDLVELLRLVHDARKKM